MQKIKVSEALSIDYNRMPEGKHAGKGPRDLVNPYTNCTHDEHGPISPIEVPAGPVGEE